MHHKRTENRSMALVYRFFHLYFGNTHTLISLVLSNPNQNPNLTKNYIRSRNLRNITFISIYNKNIHKYMSSYTEKYLVVKYCKFAN